MTRWPARSSWLGRERWGERCAGWLDAGLPASSLTILEPNPSSEIASLAADRGLALNPRVAASPPQTLVLAVKPQSLDQAAPQIKPTCGRTHAPALHHCGEDHRQPNGSPPAGAGRRARDAQHAGCDRPGGQRALSRTRTSTHEQRRWCERLLGAVGGVLLAPRRKRDRRGDGDSGSGPAYIFALTEALAAAAESGSPGGHVDQSGARYGRRRGGADASRQRDLPCNPAPRCHLPGRKPRRARRPSGSRGA